jgi:o-succinylbenzoate synthase
MQIQSINLIPYKLPFRKTWKTHNHQLSSRSGWLIELTTDTGLSGYGDCAPLPTAGTENLLQAYRYLEMYSENFQPATALEALQKLPSTQSTPAARVGIETALLDLISQSEQQTLRSWLSPDARNDVAVNSMIGSLDKDSLSAAKHALNQGYQVLKLKLGINEMKDDIQYLEELCLQLPEHIKIRLDANGSWSYKQAESFIKAIHHLPVESIEEPIHEPGLSILCKLQDSTSIALALDESIVKFKLDALLKSQAVQRLIIKPTARGSLLASLDLAKRAEFHEYEVVITSTIESAVGLQAAAQVAAVISSTNDALEHGLATSDWLLDNVAASPEINHGTLHLPDTYGLGLSPY